MRNTVCNTGHYIHSKKPSRFLVTVALLFLRPVINNAKTRRNLRKQSDVTVPCLLQSMQPMQQTNRQSIDQLAINCWTKRKLAIIAVTTGAATRFSPWGSAVSPRTTVKGAYRGHGLVEKQGCGDSPILLALRSNSTHMLFDED